MNKPRFWFLSGFLLLVAACQPQYNSLPPITTPTAVQYTAPLIQLQTDSESDPEPEGSQPTLTPVPAPTPTPQLHEVALDETMISIAYAYGLTYDELQAANPEADPYSLIVGDTLIIPAKASDDEETESQSQPSDLTLSEVNCTPDASGGLWCLFTLRAPADAGREVASAQIQLNGSGSSEALQVQVAAPINRLEAGQRMPLAGYINAQTLQSAPFTAPYQAQVNYTRDLPLNDSDGRYLSLNMSEPEILMEANSLSAQIAVIVTLSMDNPQSASRIWLAAAAYNADDECIGLQRWEAEAPLAPGETVTARLSVFSVDGSLIDHVEILAEARP